jgi:hypothetical protein
MCTNQRLLRIYCGDIRSGNQEKRGKSLDFLSEGLKLVLDIVRQEKVPPEVSFLDLVQEGNEVLVQGIQDLKRWEINELAKKEFLALAEPRIRRVIAVFLEREKEEGF